MRTKSVDAAGAWPRDGGETGRLLRDKDWRATPLGAIETWPRSLRTAVEIVLYSPVPIVMLWGTDGVILYNGAYSETSRPGNAFPTRPSPRPPH
ncbi:MAG: hypothetical protein ACXWCO_03300 [Caldimonas sp.]